MGAERSVGAAPFPRRWGVRLRTEPAGAARRCGTWPAAGKAARPRRHPRGPLQRALRGRRGRGRASGAGCRRWCRSSSARTCSGRRSGAAGRFVSPRAHLRPEAVALLRVSPPGSPRLRPPRGGQQPPPYGAVRPPAITSAQLLEDHVPDSRRKPESVP